MKTLCSCCGSEINGEVCDYCGMLIPSTTATSDDNEAGNADGALADYAEKYKKALLSYVKNFSVESESFRLNDRRTGFDAGPGRSLFGNLKDGNACRGRIFWSEDWIANPSALGIEGKEQEIAVAYQVGQRKEEAVFRLVPENSEGVVCRLGLMIDEGLQLVLVLGNEERTVASDRARIKWRKQ